MKLFYLIFLLLFAGAVAAFAYFNADETNVRYFGWEVKTKLSIIVGAAYVIGMLTGGTIWGLLRRSASNMVDALDRRAVS